MSGLDAIFAVLMVGNSLFGTKSPDMLQEALRQGTGDGMVVAQIIDDASLRRSWEESAQAKGVDARAILPEGGVTHLILTEDAQLGNDSIASDSEVYALAFAGLAVSSNPDANVYVQESWPSLSLDNGTTENAPKTFPNWRATIARDLPRWEKIVATVKAGNRYDSAGVGLIPAGQALGRLHDEIAAGQIDGLTDLTPLFVDDSHLSDMGHYFVAMVQYGALTGQNPLGLQTDFNDRTGRAFETPDPDLAHALQRVAWDAVQEIAGATLPPIPPPEPQPARAATAPAAPTGPPDVPKASPLEPVQGTKDLGIGLAPVSDRSTQLPFVDLMKSARPWTGNKPGQDGGMDLAALRSGGYLDTEGWPLRMPRELSSISTLILTDMPVQARSLEGRYVVRFKGKGVIEVKGRAKNVRYGPGEVRFDYSPGPGSVDIRVQRINTTNPPREIRVTRAQDTGYRAREAMFNPAWLARLDHFKTLRFTDWMRTDNSDLVEWADRPLPKDVTWASGVPVEVMIELANRLHKDVWLNIPHRADDEFVRAFATLVHNTLNPELKAYVEFSNEVWNPALDQQQWAEAQAKARWGLAGKGMQFHGIRAAEVARIWSEVFGDAAKSRLVNVIAIQTMQPGLETEVLTAPLGQAEGALPPVDAFDAYAIGAFFGSALGDRQHRARINAWIKESTAKAKSAAIALGLGEAGIAEHVARHRYDDAFDKAAQEVRKAGYLVIPPERLMM